MLPSVIAVWFPGDNATGMISIGVLAEDSILKGVRHPANIHAVAAAVPSVAPWLAISVPLTDVFGMGALQNTLRRVVRDGVPQVLGLHVVGDAACTTNPLLARGLCFATIYARLLVQVLDDEPDDLDVQACRFDDLVTSEVEPSFRENALFDRARVQIMRAELTGQTLPEPPMREDRIEPDEFLVAGLGDPDLYRAQMRYAMLLDPPSVLSDPSLIAQVRRIVPPGTQLPPPAGPRRGDLTRILGGT
jgi:hypothetical protein